MPKTTVPNPVNSGKPSIKICTKCGEQKSIEDFYRGHANSPDGLAFECKKCACLRQKIRYLNPIIRERAINNAITYAKSHPRSLEKARSLNKVQKERYPERIRARCAVNNAIKAGILVKKPCEVCGDTKSEGHHDDYSKPLDVRWLCDFHHKQFHNHLRDKLGLNMDGTPRADLLKEKCYGHQQDHKNSTKTKLKTKT